MTWPGVLLEAAPDELAGAVDVSALLDAVVFEIGDDVAAVRAALAADPVRIKVLSGSALEAIAQACGTTTGLPGGACAAGLFLPPRLILVPRLDWRGLLAHELTHLVDHLADRPPSEAHARRIADAV